MDSIVHLFLQGEATPDWDKGLPLDVLALVAKGKDDLKAMRSVCKSWQQGFDVSAVELTIGGDGPLLSLGSLSERFPGLVILDLGLSSVDEADLGVLSSLKRLRSLTLGAETPATAVPGQGGLWERLTNVGVQHLSSLQLKYLGLGGCKQFLDEDLEVLRDLPLTAMDLPGCTGLTSLKSLRHLPLVGLTLADCVGLTSLEDLQGMPLEVLDLGGCNQFKRCRLRAFAAFAIGHPKPLWVASADGLLLSIPFENAHQEFGSYWM